jgi:GxxExxY protein
MEAPQALSPEVEELARKVIGAAIEVHWTLGPGFLESVYEQSLAVELQRMNVLFVRQAPVSVEYKGMCVGKGRLDLLVGELLVVELKAIDELPPIYVAQAISYLKATKLRPALVINFNVRILRDGIKRVVL